MSMTAIPVRTNSATGSSSGAARCSRREQVKRMMAPVAAVDPCAGPDFLSTTVTVWPRDAREWEIAAPISPLPMTIAD